MSLPVVDLYTASAEDIFQHLIRKGNGGTTVRSTAAPALSTQFVKSTHTAQVRANTPGAFVEISYPSAHELSEKQVRKHGKVELFGYHHTRASDSLPAGSGERSARALAREENTYQLKGTFPAAALSFSKLRARIEAREGDLDSVEEVFAQFWGLPQGQVNTLPQLHLDGAEPTRMSAMEDRAYHALSGHPGHHGGYRVDMATISADALGEDVPLNWPRMRTALKAIALAQVQGDLAISRSIRTLHETAPFRFYMDLVTGAQPIYHRPYPWEKVLHAVLSPAAHSAILSQYLHVGYALSAGNDEMIIERIMSDEGQYLVMGVTRIAKLVAEASARAVAKTVEIILEHDHERALLAHHDNEEYETLATSRLSTVFEVPRYKLTRSSVNRGLTVEELGRDFSTDMVSHGKPKRQLDLSEFREAQMTMHLDMAGVLNLAAYMTTMSAVTQPYIYLLLKRVPDPRDDFSTKLSVRLRRQYLYQDTSVLELGQYLISDNFINNVDLVIRNMTTIRYRDEHALKLAIWEYLSHRCEQRRPCPVAGGWRDLIVALRELPEGWSIYYWMRISAGRKHHVTSSGILAPIAAGEIVDFLTMVKRGVKMRAKYWAAYYSAEYKHIEGKLAKKRDEKREREETEQDPQVDRYIPPHRRRLVDLEQVYDAEAILRRTAQYEVDEYERMVEMQSKSKFFASIEVFSLSTHITVGITDARMYDMLVEFYHARWYSLHKRIEKAKSQGRVFYLGKVAMPEHPWGELITELPQNYPEMLTLMVNLHPDGWTLPPEYLQLKFRKAISELWADVGNEIKQLVAYLQEVEAGLVDIQDEALRVAESDDVRKAMIGVPAIEIPTYGFEPPFLKPEKRTTISVAEMPIQVPSGQNPQLDVPVQDNELDDGFELGELDEFETDEVQLDFGTVIAAEIEINAEEYLTYRAIWHLLGFGEDTDERMRVAFGLSHDFDLDAEHADAQIAPLILRGEENLVSRKWAKKRRMMAMRLGGRDDHVLDKDM